jgi:hypothetical protein
MVPTGFVSQKRIARGVANAATELTGEVVRIRYNLGEDWSGDDAVFFRVVLQDSASQRPRLREVTRRIAETISREVQPTELGLQAYFNFRSESEQASLKEEAWA